MIVPKILMKIAVALPIVSILLIGPVDAKVIVKEQTKFYNVFAKDGKQLQRKLGRRGPWRLRRKHAIASTTRSYDIRNIKFAVRGNRCVVTSVDVHMSLIYYYPKWINKNQGSKKLQKLWKQFTKELIRHERVHGKFFKESMRIVEREILGAKEKVSANCSAMDKNLNKRLKNVNSKGEAKHAAFDKKEKRSSSKIRRLETAIVKTK